MTTETNRTLPTENVVVPPQILRLIVAAQAWAVFQDEDSELDQQTDTMLYANAYAAKQALLDAIGGL